MINLAAAGPKPPFFLLIRQLIDVIIIFPTKEHPASGRGTREDTDLYAFCRDRHPGGIEGDCLRTSRARLRGKTDEMNVGGSSNDQHTGYSWDKDASSWICKLHGCDLLWLFLETYERRIWKGVVPKIKRIVN